MRKWLIFGVLTLVLGAAGWGIQAGWIDLQNMVASKGSKAAVPPSALTAKRPVSVEVTEVKLGPISTRVSALGTLQASQSVTIQPEIAGKITRMGFREGDPVKAGAVLIELDNSILAAEKEQAETTLELAQDNYRRADILAKQGNTTARARDEASAAYHNARSAVELAKARLQKTSIAAPFDGVIGLSDVTIGRYLAIGERIVNLEAIDPLKVDFRVPELFLGSLHVGQSVSINVDAFPKQPFRGEVYAIDPLVDVEGRAVRLRARVANPDGVLRPGLFARVQLTIDQRQNAMLVPESALVPQGQDRFVYRVSEGEVSFTKVEVGERSAGQVELTGGVKPGDIIVIAGQLKLFDGATVDIRPMAAKASRD